MEQRRAAKGGEVGANGLNYKGGEFIATTPLMPQSKATRGYATRKQQVEPYVWVVPPSDNVRALFGTLSGIALYDRSNGSFSPNPNFNYAASGWTEAGYQEHLKEIKLYNSGTRWIERK